MKEKVKKQPKRYSEEYLTVTIRSVIIDKVDRLNLEDAREVYDFVCKKLDKEKQL